MIIEATIGSESHTTSRGWAKLYIDGKRMSWRDADSHEFLTTYGDKHAFWVQCTFEIKPGTKIHWEAGRNSGARGKERLRQNLDLIADSTADVFETEPLGYPAREAVLRGRLTIVEPESDE